MTRRAKALPKILAIARAEDARLGSAISEQVFFSHLLQVPPEQRRVEARILQQVLQEIADALIIVRYGPSLGGRLQLDPVEPIFQCVTDTGGEDRLTKTK